MTKILIEKATLELALEKVTNALPAYIEGVASREYLSLIHKALAQPEQKVDWEKLYRLEVKKKEAIAAKYERDIKPLTKIVPMEQPEQVAKYSDIVSDGGLDPRNTIKEDL